MKKIFVSLPMNGRDKRDIIGERNKVFLKYKLYGKDVEILDNLFDFESDNPIKYLAKSIELLADADVVHFCNGWEKARGCRIEHEVAVAYGKECVYE